MSDINLDLVSNKTVRVALSDWDFNEFSKVAEYAMRHGAIANGNIGELMVFATRYFIRDQKEAAQFFARRMVAAREKNEPTYIMNEAITQVQGMSDALDSDFDRGDTNGRP